MGPFRPAGGASRGKIRWHEINVGVLARLSQRRTQTGHGGTRMGQPRLVAVVGDSAARTPCLWLEVVRLGLRSASQVVWLSDGGRGLWRLCEECFASHVRGLAPHDATSPPARGEIVGRGDARLTQTAPPRGPRAPQAPRLIGTLLVALQEAAQAGLPGLPLAARGRLVGHGAQALQCPQGRVAAGGDGGIASWRPRPGRAAEMREAGGTVVAPVVRAARAIAAQEAVPRVAQGTKGLLGTVGLHALGGHGRGSAAPEPWQGVLTVPGRCLKGAARGLGRPVALAAERGTSP